MAKWKKLFILIACVLGMASPGWAETELIIVSAELPPEVSEQPEKSFVTSLFREVEKEMGVKFIFRFMPWKRCVLDVRDLRAWGMIPCVRTPEREITFYFSERLYKMSMKFFGYSPDGKMKTISYEELSDLKNYRIGGVIGYHYIKVFHDAGTELELVVNEEQNIKKLWFGRIDLAPIEENGGWYRIKNIFPGESGKFFTVPKPFFEGDVFMMTSKQYPDTQNLLKKFNTALKTVKEKGIFQQVAEKHEVTFTP